LKEETPAESPPPPLEVFHILMEGAVLIIAVLYEYWEPT
jgi:hypothetical protein